MITCNWCEKRTTQILYIWQFSGNVIYALYNVQLFWPCEITEAWHCSLRSGGRGSWIEKSAWSGLTECFLSMQVCFSKHIKDMFEADLCVTTDIQLTKKHLTGFVFTKYIEFEHLSINDETAGHIFKPTILNLVTNNTVFLLQMKPSVKYSLGNLFRQPYSVWYDHLFMVANVSQCL